MFARRRVIRVKEAMASGFLGRRVVVDFSGQSNPFRPIIRGPGCTNSCAKSVIIFSNLFLLKINH